MAIDFTGERIVPGAANCDPLFDRKMFQEHIARYVFASAFAQGARVLDVGCGVGYGSHYLRQNGAAFVKAFDLSEGAVGHARENFATDGLEYSTANAETFDFGEKFDLVVCFELIEHVNDQKAVLERIAAHLKPDGLMVMSTPRQLEAKRTHFHTEEFTLERFEALLGERFPKVRMFVENNHFSSIVTEGLPALLRKIELTGARFGLDDADYFIALASLQRELSGLSVEPVLVLNDDRYVLQLERDVEVLHRAEDDLKASVRLTGEALSQEQARLAATQTLLQEARAQVQLLQTSIEQTRSDLASTQTSLQEARAQVQQLQTSIEKTCSDLASRDKALSELSGRHAGAQDDIRYLQDAIDQMQRSTSWRATTPLRVAGSAAKRTISLADKANRYRSQFGNRALIKAVGRRLSGKHQSFSQPPASDKLALIQGDSRSAGPALHPFYDAVFLIGCWEGESKRYRVYNLAETMRAQGLAVLVLPFSDCGRIIAEKISARTVIFFRATLDPRTPAENLLAYCKDQGIVTVFDVDDLIFDESIVGHIHGFSRLPAADQRQYLSDTRLYAALMQRCDLVTVTTPALARAAVRLNPRVAVIPNTINQAQLDVAAAIGPRGTVTQSIVLGYFSGSKTHERDFATCEAALIRVLQENALVRLRIVGHLDLGPHWAPFESRVERVPFLPYLDMLKEVARVDINIAPLEVGNPFCEGKSDLKYFEAALVGVPTIASPTEPFQSAIRSGENGYLAHDEASWYQALSTLVGDADLRDRVARAAYEDVTARCLPANLYDSIKAAWRSAQAEPAAATNPNGLRIDWVIPGLIIGGGGHRNILRAAYHLSKFGHSVVLHFTNADNTTAAELKAKVRKHFYPIDCEVKVFDGRFRDSDVIFATHWSTVSAAQQGRSRTKEIMYFVQDYEPSFAPMGSEYVLAENTYRQGLYCITSGPWCEVVLKRDFHAEADHFVFPIDKGIYYPRERRSTRKTIVFFAKPEMPRRCFEIGLMALRQVHSRRPDIEIQMFGSANAARQAVDFPVVFRDVLPTLDDLAQMYSDGDLGMVFSTTNPSLVPYEMMACGLPVVDLGRPGNEVNYAGSQDIALLADPMPERMAEQVIALIDDTAALKARRERGLAFTATFPTEDEMAARVEELIVKRMVTKHGYALKGIAS